MLTLVFVCVTSSTGSEGTLDDGGSRFGENAGWQFRPGYWLSGRAEVGFNLLSSLDSVFNPGASSSGGNDDVFLRLFYASIRFDSSTSSDANEASLSKTYTIGILWNTPK